MAASDEEYVYNSVDSDEDGGFVDDDDADSEYEYVEDDAGVPPAPPVLKRQASYIIYEQNEIVRHRDEMVRELMELTGLDEQTACLVLLAYRWSLRMAQERWFEDEARARDRAGAHGPAVAPDAHQTFVCVICDTEYSETLGTALACGHRFCANCWRGHLEYALQYRGFKVVGYTCPMADCTEVIPPKIGAAMLADPEKKQKLHEFWLRSFVEGSTDLCWCPGPGCGRAVECPHGSTNIEVTCACGTRFCFGCGEEAHRPASCALVHKWNKKNSSQSENVTWIMANTKPCPKCGTNIEKNQGCNHMTCRAGRCGHEFCWLCMQPWATHGSATGGYYRCNKYEGKKRPADQVRLEMQREAARRGLNRYMHFAERYLNHRRSMRMGKKLRESMANQVKTMQEVLAFKLQEVVFLQDAVEEVIECRRVLQWTYAIGYYLEPGREQDLFEHVQENLEKNLEHLHELVEQDLHRFLSTEARHDFFVFRTEVTNFTNVTRKFRNNMMDAVERGLTDVVGGSGGAGASATGK